jgi:hypothetical protein
MKILPGVKPLLHLSRVSSIGPKPLSPNPVARCDMSSYSTSPSLISASGWHQATRGSLASRRARSWSKWGSFPTSSQLRLSSWQKWFFFSSAARSAFTRSTSSSVGAYHLSHAEIAASGKMYFAPGCPRVPWGALSCP